jgi:hypothetical protein
MRLLPLFTTLAALVIVGCTPDRDPVQPEPGSGTGAISVGPFVSAGSVPVGPAGGTINVTEGPISGFQIEVAPGAFAESKTVTVSSAPVTEHSLGADFNPISPMIRVDYGGGYAAEPMLVRVPVRVPAGHFGMGFYYDEDTGEVEGIPVAGITDSAVVLLARHFSGASLRDAGKNGLRSADTFADILVASVAADKLYNAQDSGFRPGIDDWEFPNFGSYISPGGHCTGQSLTALWYYSARKLGAAEPPLYNRFSTFSGMWYDNRDGYRFASVVQEDFDNTKVRNWAARFDSVGTTRFQHDELHYLAFAYSIHLSRKPQLIFADNSSSAHAMIVYRTDNRLMSIADPNFPSTSDHFVALTESGSFQPYESRPTADAPLTVYPKISYMAKTAVMSFEEMATRYNDMQRHTIGDYPPNVFPPVDLMWLDGTDWRVLADTLASDADTLTLIARCQTCGVVTDGNKTRFLQVDANGAFLSPPYLAGTMRVPLAAGDSRLYFVIVGKKDPLKPNGYIDFKTVVIRKQAIETYPITNATQTTATGGGDVAADNGFPITARGVCWSNAPNPTIADDHTVDGSGLGVFVSQLTGLTLSTLYYVRAYATNSQGTTYGNEVSFTTAARFAIGQNYGGGIIFYIDGPGEHGLIAAPSDLNDGVGAAWGADDTTHVGGTDVRIGAGQANTEAILRAYSQPGIAARLCDDLELNGYGDWFLPSSWELYELCRQKELVGGLHNSYYWSSSENYPMRAFNVNVGDCTINIINRLQVYYVRAVRAF